MKRLVQAYMIEARWNHYNHTPTIKEYMQEDTTVEVLIWVTNDLKIVAASIIICRLMNEIVGDEVHTKH
ncbi:putative terpene synthase 2, partial [Mucuna pruriens]